MAESVLSTMHDNNSGELVPIPQPTSEVAVSVHSPEETLKSMASSLVDLRDRVTALPSGLPDDPNNVLGMRRFNGKRGVSISIKKNVIEIGDDGSQQAAEHFYEAQVRSEAEDTTKPFATQEDSFSVSFFAETDTRDHLGVQFRGAGSLKPIGVRLRAMDGPTEMEADQVQNGINAILAELSSAVGVKEELARSLSPTAGEHAPRGSEPATTKTEQAALR